MGSFGWFSAWEKQILVGKTKIDSLAVNHDDSASVPIHNDGWVREPNKVKEEMLRLDSLYCFTYQVMTHQCV